MAETKTGTVKAVAKEKGGILLEEAPTQWLNPVTGTKKEEWLNINKGDKVEITGTGNNYNKIVVIEKNKQLSNKSDDRTNTYIIRQAVIKAAVDFLKDKDTEDYKQILDLAESFEKWVLR